MLRKIDILPLQVRIDAVIAEVQLNDNLQYGTQFFFKSGGHQQHPERRDAKHHADADASTGATEPQLSGVLHRRPWSGRRAIRDQCAAAVTQVHVLSSPELLVLDNQPARLQVGNVVPYLTQSSQSQITANAPVVNSVNYQQTGVVMEVTPRVNSGGLVTLDVMQDVSMSPQGSPRRASTRRPSMNAMSPRASWCKTVRRWDWPG